MPNKNITLSYKTYIRDIPSIKNYKTSITRLRRVMQINLSLEEYCTTQEIRKAYLAFIYEQKALFKFFYIV